MAAGGEVKQKNTWDGPRFLLCLTKRKHRDEQNERLECGEVTSLSFRRVEFAFPLGHPERDV